MKKALISLFVALLFVIGSTEGSFATRPLYTEDTLLAPFTKVILETGILLLSARDNTGYTEVISSVKYGIANNIELSIDLPYVTRYAPGGNYDGLNTGSFQAKFKLYSGDVDSACLQFGYQIDAIDPSRIMDSNAHNITSLLIYSRNFWDTTYILNAGYTFDDTQAGLPRNDFILYNIAFTKPLNSLTNIAGEVQYSYNTYTTNIVGETAIGLNYKYNNFVTFDTAIGCGLNENSSSSNFVVGATFAID
jgi:hypothetical protein